MRWTRPIESVLALAATLALVASAHAADLLGGPDLLAALRQGGYVIYFRHTATDFGQNDERMTGYEDCSTQRNLTDAGRADARAIGASIRALGIPVGDVVASPYCRTIETARLMFGRANPSTAVRGGPAQANAERYAELTTLISARIAQGGNLVIASHGNPYRAIVGGAYLEEGEAAVIEPLGEGRYRVVARVRKYEWDGMANPGK
jgi:broad specificity phosphatase PhoE